MTDGGDICDEAERLVSATLAAASFALRGTLLETARRSILAFSSCCVSARTPAIARHSATISVNTVTLSGAGTVTVRASQGGTANVNVTNPTAQELYTQQMGAVLGMTRGEIRRQFEPLCLRPGKVLENRKEFLKMNPQKIIPEKIA